MKFGDIKKFNVEFQIEPNHNDGFEHLTIINGLYVKDGGTPVDYVLNKILYPIRDKLIKKYKTIKPGDIKSKIKLYLNMRFVKDLKFNSQTKEAVKNNIRDLDEYFKDFDWDKIVRQILRDDDIMLMITEYFALKEQAKENAELKKLSKKERKLKIEKFYPAIKNNKNIFIVEGESANVAIQPVLGRQENSYFELKGVPLNSWEVTSRKLASNEELSNLFKILKNYESQIENDGKWFEVEIDNTKIIVNENDEILIDGKYVEVKELLEKQNNDF